MRYNPIVSTLFIKNRIKLANILPSETIAILNANDIMPTNADGSFPFRQNNDLYYLSGIDQEETKLIIFPDAQTETDKEILFIKKTSDLIAIWEGHKLTKKEATDLSGIANVYWLDEFDSVLNRLSSEAKNIALNANAHSRSTSEVQTRDNRFRSWCKRHYPSHKYITLSTMMHTLRYIKEPEEIAVLQHACDITEKAFRRILKFIKPGIKEYEIEAEITHEFIKRGSKGHAYQPIVASGADACILHYIDNHKTCNDNELILMDFGAEYANYNADLTRTIPVNGRYSKRQKEVYNAVLRVQRQAIQLLTVGTTFETYNKAIGEFMEKELVDLRLLSVNDIKNQGKTPAYRKYFMHGTSHSLGLDVHDVDDRSIPFAEGMVFTCEPGIYIREEGIGIRIENDLVVTNKTPLDLMQQIPIEAEEIEALMQG